jgi:hypothetical protein
MPQFDIFSFFSQLFWVFVGFLLLYLSICFYLLPALGSILKIRKRKLAQVTTKTDGTTLMSNSSFLEAAKHNLSSFNVKLNSLTNDNISGVSSVTPTLLSENLDTVSIKFEALREHNATIFSQAQQTTLLYI